MSGHVTATMLLLSVLVLLLPFIKQKPVELVCVRERVRARDWASSRIQNRETSLYSSGSLFYRARYTQREAAASDIVLVCVRVLYT